MDWAPKTKSPPVAPVTRNRNDFAFRRLFLKLHLISRQAQNFLLSPGQCACRHDLQSYDGVRGTPDQLHHVVEAPADHVDHFALDALCDAGYTVVGLQLSVHCCGPARNDVDHHDVVIVDLQRCADAEVRQAHLNPVFLGIAWRQITGMRV